MVTKLMIYLNNIFKVSVVILMVLTTFMGCSSEDDSYSTESQRLPIAFTAYAARMTKTVQSDIGSSTNFSFAVTAIGNGQYYFKKVTFGRQKIDGSYQWTTSTKFYWTYYPLTFYAYSKATKVNDAYPTSIEISAPTIGEGEPSLTVSIPTEMSKQEDLVAAYSPNTSAPTTRNTCQLTFNHYMTRVAVQARCMNKNYKVMVKGVKLAHMAKSGVYTFAGNKMTATAADVSSATSSIFKESYESDAVTLNSATAEVAEPDYKSVMQGSSATTSGRWYLIPQTVTSWAQATDQTNENNGTYLGLWVKITTQKGTKIFPADKTWTATNEWAWMAVEIPEDLKFEQGKKYTVSLNFFSATGKGAGFQDPEADGPVKPGKGNSAVGSTNLILFGTEVNEWSDEVGVTIDL